MSNPLSDQSLFRANDAFYPTGYVFAMLKDVAAAQDAVPDLSKIDGVGSVETVSEETITNVLEKGANKAGGMPSLGPEHHYMLRFIELAQRGCYGLLIDLDHADKDTVARTLEQHPVELAYFYGSWVIEELVASSKRADDAASGEL